MDFLYQKGIITFLEFKHGNTESENNRLPYRENCCKHLFLRNPINEPLHDKTNKMTCAPSEDFDQPGHLPSLIRASLVHSMDSQGPIVNVCSWRLIRLGGCPGRSASSLAAKVILFVLSWMMNRLIHFARKEELHHETRHQWVKNR